MKRFICILVFLTIHFKHSVSQIYENDCEKCERLLNVVADSARYFDVYFHVNKIPKQIRGLIDFHENEKGRIANPGRRFNETDVIKNIFQPKRRLFLYFKLIDIHVVFLEVGGMGKRKVAYLIQFENNKSYVYCQLHLAVLSFSEMMLDVFQSRSNYRLSQNKRIGF
jgi:hypothetical protein